MLRWLMLGLLTVTLLGGCTGGREKGRNQDQDRPKPTTK